MLGNLYNLNHLFLLEFHHIQTMCCSIPNYSQSMTKFQLNQFNLNLSQGYQDGPQSVRLKHQ
jgi:hypothetical protein